MGTDTLEGVPEAQPESAEVEVKTAPSGRSYLDLINLELKHGGQGAASVLAEDPARWLAGLGAILHSIKVQRETRDRAFEAELSRDHRGVDWPQVERSYRDWSRKITAFESVVRLRIRTVRRLVPQDDLVAIIEEGTLLSSRDRDGIRAWQARAAAALQTYTRPAAEAPKSSTALPKPGSGSGPGPKA